MALACTHAASFRSTNTVAIRFDSSSSGHVVITTTYSVGIRGLLSYRNLDLARKKKEIHAHTPAPAWCLPAGATSARTDYALRRREGLRRPPEHQHVPLARRHEDR